MTDDLVVAAGWPIGAYRTVPRWQIEEQLASRPDRNGLEPVRRGAQQRDGTAKGAQWL